jgi:hypothetical protein
MNNERRKFEQKNIIRSKSLMNVKSLQLEYMNAENYHNHILDEILKNIDGYFHKINIFDTFISIEIEDIETLKNIFKYIKPNVTTIDIDYGSEKYEARNLTLSRNVFDKYELKYESDTFNKDIHISFNSDNILNLDEFESGIDYKDYRDCKGHKYTFQNNYIKELGKRLVYASSRDGELSYKYIILDDIHIKQFSKLLQIKIEELEWLKI